MGRLSTIFKSMEGRLNGRGGAGTWAVSDAGGERSPLGETTQDGVRANVAAPCDSPGNSAPCERIAAISSAGVIS